MPGEGLEPSHPLEYTILSRARLPIPPLRHFAHAIQISTRNSHYKQFTRFFILNQYGKIVCMEHSSFQNNAVFFIEVDKIKPNPFQPRKEFDPNRLQELADSIRMYGILQPLVVTRHEKVKDDGGIATEYELIAGERRLRASKLAGLKEVPALIRSTQDDDRTKLELAIIENLQREDLNSIDRALAFQQLAEKFNFTHAEIGKKVGRSREYISNTIRILLLPPEMQDALRDRKISEGHTRPLLMLADRPEEQMVLFREILLKKMTVRDAEKISRKIAYDKVRKKERMFNPEIVEWEEEVSSTLGTRVHIEPREVGGRIEIDYFDEESLRKIMEILRTREAALAGADETVVEETVDHPKNKLQDDDDLYSLKNFSI